MDLWQIVLIGSISIVVVILIGDISDYIISRFVKSYEILYFSDPILRVSKEIRGNFSG